MKAKIIPLAVAALLLTGCAGYQPVNTEIDSVLNKWIGMHKSDLILAIGPPLYVMSDGNNGEILIYESLHSVSQVPGKAGYNGLTKQLYYTAPIQIQNKEIIQIYTNPDGVIYYWRYNEGNPGNESKFFSLMILFIAGMVWAAFGVI